MEFFVSIITVFMSGVIAAVVTYRLNMNKDHVFFMRQKAEELYLATERYDKILSGYFLTFYPLFSDELEYNDVFDLQIKKSGQGSSHDHELMTMLTRIYFPEIEPLYDRFSEAREEANKIVAAHKRAYKAGKAGGVNWTRPFTESLVDLDAAAEAFKSAIVAQAHNFNAANRHERSNR